MSLFDYEVSKQVSQKDYPFYSLLFALLRQADTNNAAKIRALWPDHYAEFEARYNAPGGYLEGEAP